MTELALLERRRELVMLSASLQRATLSRRLAAVEARPGRSLLGFVMTAVGRPTTRKLAFAALAMAWRTYRKHRAKRG